MLRFRVDILEDILKWFPFYLWRYVGAGISAEKEGTYSRRQVCGVDRFVCESCAVLAL